METFSLNGTWEADYFITSAEYGAWKNNCRVLHQMLRDSAMSSGFITGDPAPGAMKGTIPGCDRSFLRENGLCDDPYFGRNLEFTSFSENYSWAFRKKFTVPESFKGKRIILKFNRVDYHAAFFLNGEFIGEHADMFYGISLEITDSLKYGQENVLAVMFYPAPQGMPDHHSDVPADFAAYHRTQIGFGWDWSRKFVPTGIVDDVTLMAYENYRINDAFIRFDGKKAVLEVAVYSRCDAAERVNVEFFDAGTGEFFYSTGADIQLKSGDNSFTMALDLPENLQLWYPNGSGKAALYRMCVTLQKEVYEKVTGFRSVTMSRNPDSPEGAYDLTFNINGEPVFVKGVNYVPADLMLSEVKSVDYEYLVSAAHAAGINLFRIWGGGVIEKDAFYDACDRYGIMVWQEFMHACSKYPKDPEFLAAKAREGRNIILSLRHHPCISLFCGGNELLYYGEIPDSPMLKKYEELVNELMPGIPYHTTSPDLSRPGERHHGPWHYQGHDAWNTHFRQFASELGCNGMPDYASLCRFIPESELHAMSGPALAYHFFNQVGLNDLRRPVNEFFQVDDMEKFCAASMFSQADTIQYIMEHYRRLAPRSSGCIFWQYNEPWPTCSWNVIDYYGYPKMAFYALKRANAPVLLSLQDDSWAVKDGRLSASWFITCDREFTGKVGMEVFSAAGVKIFEAEKSGSWDGNTALLDKLDLTLPPGLSVVFFSIDGEYAGYRVYGVPDFKSFFELPVPAVTAEVRGNCVTVRNEGKCVAFNIKLAFPDLPDKQIFFKDNYLTLAPGEVRKVEFCGSAGDGKLSVFSLNNVSENQ